MRALGKQTFRKDVNTPSPQWFKDTPDRMPAPAPVKQRQVQRPIINTQPAANPLQAALRSAAQPIPRDPDTYVTGGEISAPHERGLGEWLRDGSRSLQAGFNDFVSGQVNPWEKDKSLAATTGASIQAGIGGMQSTVGGVTRRLGNEELGKKWTEAGDRTQKQFGTPYDKPITAKTFIDPQFYATSVAEAVPFAVSLIPAAIAGAYGASAAGAAAGLGAFGQAVLGTLGATAVSRPLESAMEAGGVYNEAKTRGMKDEEAKKAADETFLKNLPLGLSDAGEIILSLWPGLRPFAKIAEKAGKVGKVAVGAGKIAAVGAMEAGEEGAQEVIQRQALGTDNRPAWQQLLEPDAAMKQAMAVGGVFGVGLGTSGKAYNYLKERVVTGLSPQGQQTFDTVVKGYMAQGMTPEQGIEKALNDLAATQHGKAHVEAVVQEVAATEPPVTFDPAELAGEMEAQQQAVPVAEMGPVDPLGSVEPAVEPAASPVDPVAGEVVATEPIIDVPEAPPEVGPADPSAQTEPTTDPPSATGQTQGAFDALGGGAKKAGKQRTIDQVAKQGYVAFKNPQAADIFRNDPDYIGWTEENVNGEYRFRPPTEPAEQKPQETTEPAPQKETPPELIVYRRDTKDANISSKKPHGLYLSLVDNRDAFKTPHEHAGDTDYWGKAKPKKPLVANYIMVDHDRFGVLGIGRGYASAGVAALEKLLPENEFNEALKMGKQELINLLTERSPGHEYNKYYDAYELLEVYAAQLAREQGYDAIIQRDPEFSQFSELVALNDDILELEKSEPTPTAEPPKSASGITVTENEQQNGVEIKFPGKPSEDIIRQLHQNGFRWSPKQKLWYAKRTPGRMDFAKGLTGQGEPETGVKVAVDEKPGTEIVIPKPTESGTIEAKETPSRQIAEKVKQALKEGRKIITGELQVFAQEAHGSTLAEGKYDRKDIYDAMELGVNLYLLEHKKSVGSMAGVDIAKRSLEWIQSEILANLPTQSVRSAEQDEFQQFSTPPNLAYVAAWVASPSKADIVLEPSAGIGGLAVFAKTAGAKVIVNELSPRRAAIIKEMGFDQVFTEDAEQINNILPKDVKPTLVIMNPPFSAAGHRGLSKNTKLAEAHIEQALKRLQPNGRLVAIVGRGMSEDAATFKIWWKKIKQEYNVQANIGIDGKNYAKYGTTFDVQLLVIDKTGATPANATATGEVKNLEDVLPMLEAIKNDRTAAQTDRQGQQNAGEPNSQTPAKTGGAKAGSGSDLPVPTDRVGTGQREGGSQRPGEQGPRDIGSAGDGQEPGVSQEPAEGNGLPDEGGTGRRGPGSNVGGRPGTGEAENTTGSSGVPGGKASERGAGEAAVKQVPGRLDSEIAVEQDTTAPDTADLSDAVFTDYKPQKLKIKGAHPHPGNLAQSAAMAAVEPPAPTYTPNLPKEVIKDGKLSLAQLEAVVYAGQSHQQTLPEGQRKGFFIGDGTGVGKGREISGIILDNWRQGRKKAVWISKNNTLFEDAKRDFGNVGGDSGAIFELKKAKTGTAVNNKEGIVFTTHDTLGQGLETSRSGEVSVKEGKKSRLDQLVNWLGKDFDGVIAFDEAHMMQNSMPQKGKRGVKKAATRAIAGVELQKRLPNARIVYVSATGATEVANLAYADRLGLWGKGTPFANKMDFIGKVQAGGLAAMELVARDMKAMGVYIARNLSFDGVTYGTSEHQLTPEQVEIYDTMANGWQVVLQNIYKALETTGQSRSSAKRNVMGQFWSAQQRFFNQVLTSMQMPTVINMVKDDLVKGNAVVMQLVNTNEAAQNRQISAMEDEEELENLDLTPREMLMQYLEKSFPTQQYEEYLDDNDNVRSRPVVDSHGNPVINQEAQAMKDELLAKLGSMKVPEGPLEIVLNSFGADNVAEITGRTRRVVKVKDEAGRVTAKLENRGQAQATADAAAFMDNRKQILIFSDAGGTGRSYHADLTAKNQRKRIHYLIQAGWKADSAVQGFGRTHRTNQASAPHYVLVTTALKGQKRFISSIARRLDQLGALTKGQRQTGSQGLFSARDNLEGPMAKDALQRFYDDLEANRIPGLEMKDLLTKMGLAGLIDDNGKLKESEDTRDITKFLNRILALDSRLQNKVFDEFADRMDRLIEAAIANGTLDVGLENYRADKVKVTEEKPVYTDKESGAETKYMGLEASFQNKKVTFEKVSKLSKLLGFYKNTKSGRLYAVTKAGIRTLESGNVVEVYTTNGQIQDNFKDINKPDFQKGNWEEVPDGDARLLWEEALAKTPDYRTEKVHLITGALLPIWDRLPEGHVRVIRVRTDDGRTLLGRQVPERHIDLTLKRLGANRDKQEISPADMVSKIQDDGYSIYLANEWKLVRRRVSGEYRIEIIGNDLWKYRTELDKEGVFSERISFETRFFIPTGERAADVIASVIKYRPVVDVVAPGGKGETAATRERSPSLSSVQEEMSEKVDDAIGEVQPKIGMSVQWIGGPKNKKAGTKKFSFNDPDIQDRIDAAEGVKGEPLGVKLRRWAVTFKNQITREYEHLPRTSEFAILRDGLLKLAKQKGVRADESIRLIQGITINLDRNQYDNFRYKVLLDDLMEELKAEHRLPFGFDADKLPQEWEALNEFLQDDPEVQNAINDRNKIWKAIKAEYIRDMKSIGFDVEDRFSRDSYFRHQVLEYANAKGLTGTGQKLKSPTGRGFLKQRQGSEFDINTDYLQAEFEVMSQMLYDIQVAKTIKMVDDNYNVMEDLKAQAAAINNAGIMAMFRDAAKYIADRTATDEEINELAEKLYRQNLNKKQAMGFGRLYKMAANNQLPVGPKGEFADLVDAMADAYLSGEEGRLDDDLNGQLFKFLSYLMKASEGGGAAAMIFKGIREKKEFIKEALAERFVTWEDLTPDGYTLWQPREGNVFFMADSIPAKLAEAIQNGALDQLGINPEDIQKVMVMGGKRRQFVVKEEIAETLDNLVKAKPEGNALQKLGRSTTIAWKIWTLTNPRRVIKYNFRNLTGDADAAFAGNPAGFKYVPQAVNELYQTLYGDKSMTPNMKDWFERGGMETLLQAQELGDVNKLGVFKNLIDVKAKEKNIPLSVWKYYWRQAKLATDYREAILRYANYLSYLDQVAADKDGRPKNFGASIPEEIMALPDIEDRAFRLSNELLGAYDQISVIGQGLREYLIPFWSWNEVNFRRYKRLFQNAARDGKLMEAVGRKFVAGTVIRSPIIAYRIGKFVVMATAFWSILQAWNLLRYPDEEDDLPEDVKAKPHIIFGRDSKGNVQYFSRLGSLADLLDWFGVDAGTPNQIADWLNGRRTAKEIAVDMAKSPVNKFVSGVTPFVKAPLEALLMRQTFPDVFEPRSIRDRMDYLAQSLGLENEYRSLTGKPTKGYAESLRNLVTYEIEPGQAAYYGIVDRKYEYGKKMGKGNMDGSFRSAKSDALYYFKLAIRYRDKEAADKYLLGYAMNGGTVDGLERSLGSLHPLYGLASKPKDGADISEQQAFVNQLDKEGEKDLLRAIRYYEEVLLGNKGADVAKSLARVREGTGQKQAK